MKMCDIKPGMFVCVDSGFSCMDQGIYKIEFSERGPFVRCREGEHLLDGQEDEETGQLIGIKVYDPE